MFLIMKILSKIRIHPFFYVVLFFSFFTGNIRDFLAFSLLVIIHEFGHVCFGILFGWNIDRIIILPFGGLTVFNILINTSLFEQFVVAIMGPIFQIIFYFVFSFFYFSSRFQFFNFLLLVFNLIPIFPLDGSKILNVFFNLIFPFKFSHLFSLFFSFVFIILFFLFFDFNLFLFLSLLFLFFSGVREFVLHRSIFNKFLFERYVYSFSFRRVISVKDVKSMRVWCRHLFFYDNTYISEKKMLSKRFDK